MSKLFDAMVDFPFNMDWYAQVKLDLSDLDMNWSLLQIQLMSKREFKKVLRKKLRRKSDEYLLNLQSNHSKTSRLVLSDQPQEYLMTKQLSTDEKCFLFSLKCRMTKSKNNYTSMFSDQLCRFCLRINSDETLEHFCNCSTLIQTIPEVSTIDPGAIYGTVLLMTK